MTKGEIGFHPKQVHPAHRFFWCLQSAWGTVVMDTNQVLLGVRYGSIEIRRLRSSSFVGRVVAAATLNGHAQRYTQRQETLTLARPAALTAGSVLRLDLRPGADQVAEPR